MGRICACTSPRTSTTPSGPLRWLLSVSRGCWLSVPGGLWRSTQWKSVPSFPPSAPSPFVADPAGPDAETDNTRCGTTARASMLSGSALVPSGAPLALAARLRPAAVVVAAPVPRLLPGLSSPCRRLRSSPRAPGSSRTLRPPSSGSAHGGPPLAGPPRAPCRRLSPSSLPCGCPAHSQGGRWLLVSWRLDLVSHGGASSSG